MREPPGLPVEQLVRCLHDAYGLKVAELAFLPLGNDAAAGVYRVQSGAGSAYFVKVKRGAIAEISVRLPYYLHQQGMDAAAAPLPTREQTLWQMVEGYTVIVYPFITGQMGSVVGLSDSQWTAFGRCLKALHLTELPPDLRRLVPQEAFMLNPGWMLVISRVAATYMQTFSHSVQRELARFWRGKWAEIRHVLRRAATLGQALQRQPLARRLCHADIHTSNVLVSPDGQLFFVDWDQPIFAPPERDLMFVVDDPAAPSPAVQAFFHGYGETSVNPLALDYYRVEWAVQEISDYAERVFFLPDVSDATRQESLEEFIRLFEAGHEIDAALYQTLT